MFNLFNKKKKILNLDEFLEEAIPFGSRVWGGATSKSDYDYLLHTRYLKSLVKFLKKNGIKFTTEDSYQVTLGCDELVTFRLNDRTYQFIFFNKQYDKFVTIFKLIASYTQNRVLTTKTTRNATVSDFYEFLSDKVKRPYITEFLKEHHPEYLI